MVKSCIIVEVVTDECDRLNGIGEGVYILDGNKKKEFDDTKVDYQFNIITEKEFNEYLISNSKYYILDLMLIKNIIEYLDEIELTHTVVYTDDITYGRYCIEKFKSNGKLRYFNHILLW